MKIKIENVKKVKLEKGDTLVFEIEQVWPKYIVEKYTCDLKTYFPEQKILVLTGGVSLKTVLREKKNELQKM